MSTDFQTARVALGARLRELRTEARLNGKELAARLGWQPSKISRIENGKQTPSLDDLEAWVAAVQRPDAIAELRGRLNGLESQYRSWRRQLSGGHRARQEIGATELSRTRQVRGLETDCIPGLFQTPDYARHMFLRLSDFRQSPVDTDEAARSRIKQQSALYEPGRKFRFLIWEGALHVRFCPDDVLAAQLDRLAGIIGLDTVDLGIIPLSAPLRLTPAHGFWIYDERLVIVETINAELWLDDTHNIALYQRAWDWLAGSSVHGSQAQQLIARTARSLSRS
ncbi:helix-turn-helix transcriptional regulator [Streptomyces sp. B6B3]|uniref:helix-turn-helix domain-containing protein n=1 Tax=Streptomyces sp. B6B3 TaxID=3153570 RepID=UPI00325F6181